MRIGSKSILGRHPTSLKHRTSNSVISGNRVPLQRVMSGNPFDYDSISSPHCS